MTSKADILAEVEKSRAAIVRDFRETAEEIDPRVQAGRLYSKSPFLFLGVAAALGWVIAGPRKVRVRAQKRVPAKGKSAAKKKRSGLVGIIFSVVRLALPMIKPAISAYAAKRFSELAKGL